MIGRSAYTLAVNEVGVLINTRSGRFGWLDRRSRGSGLGNTHSAAESISVDTVTSFFEFVIDGEGRTSSTYSTDILVPSNADTFYSGEVELFIFATSWSANSQLGIVGVGRNTVGADSFHEVEILLTSTDIVHEFFIDFALRDGWLRRFNGRLVDLSAYPLDESVSLSAFAGKGVEDVGGVGRTNMTDSTDQVIPFITNASLIFVYLVLSADRVLRVIWITNAAVHVVPSDADTLAKDIVVDLVSGTVYLSSVCFVVDGN